MKKLMLTLASMAMLLTGCKEEPQPQKIMFLAIGQSNMVGKGIVTPEDMEVSPRFLNLASTDTDDRTIGQWRVAAPGNCRPGYDYPQQVSLTDHFGSTLLEYLAPIDSLAVLQVAVDGCPMRLFDVDQYQGFCDSCQMDWMNGQLDAFDRNPYGRLVSLAQKAQQEGWVIRGLLVHQGETDAYSEYWPKELDKVYHSLLDTLHLEAVNVPVLVGEVVGLDQNGVCAHANPMLDRVHEFIPTAWTISSVGCQVSEDNLHFSAEGYHLLGKRYAQKWLQLNGYDVKDVDTTPLQCEMGEAGDAFRVDVQLNEAGDQVLVNAAVALQSVDIVSYSGAKLATIELNGQRTAALDITPYATEDRLVLNIHDYQNQVVNRQVNR